MNYSDLLGTSALGNGNSEKFKTDPAVGSYGNFKGIYKGKKVLIVEDIPSNYQLLEAFLLTTGIEIIHEIDGENAFKAYKNNPDIDLVLMDIRLHDISGLLVTKMIRELSPEIPIIAQTAYALDSDRYQCLAAGCNDYIAKPIRRNQLFRIVHKYLS
jgi:CheY-like chemotaxis protein